jgi:hypothetical protein
MTFGGPSFHDVSRPAELGLEAEFRRGQFRPQTRHRPCKLNGGSGANRK